MNIVVCVKQILDPQIPAAKFRIDPEAKRVLPPEGIPPVVNPFDARAVELGLRLKERCGGKISVLSVGQAGATAVIKHALAMGADEGFLLSDPAFDNADSHGVAHILSKAVQKIGDYNLILCGRQAADMDEGLVGSLLAENLGLPLVTLAQSVELTGNELKVKRVITDGFQVFAVPMPALITVSNEVGQPRLPSGLGIISAARKKIPIWKAADINSDPSQTGADSAKRRLVALSSPQRERKCEFVTGETAPEAGARLAQRLRSARII